MGQLAELAGSLFGESTPPSGVEPGAGQSDSKEGTSSATDQAKTFNILSESNIDPRQVFKEAPPLAVQKLLGRDGLNQIKKFYGPQSVYTDPDDRTYAESLLGINPETVGLPRGGLSEVFRNIFGSSATEEQISAAKEAADLVVSRSSNMPGPSSVRAREELLSGRTPTRAELAATDAPLRASGKEFDPFLQDYLKKSTGYNIETPEARARVIERDYGLVSQIADKDRVGAKLRQDIAWGLELPKDSEGKNVALEFVRPILLKEINAKYRTDASGNITDPYTAEALDLQVVDLGQDGKRISFRHPSDPTKVTLLDPVNFEWADVLENLPMLLTPAVEVGAAVVGGFGSAVVTGGNPGAVFAGTTAAAAGGAFAGRLLTQNIALDNLGYTKDFNKGGYVKRRADGKQVVVKFEDLMFDRMTDAEWSILGSGAGAGLFRIARSLYTRGSSEINAFMPEKKFIEAAEEFSKTQRGIELRAAGIPATPSYIIDSKADEILREAAELNDPSAYAKAVKLANKYRAAAGKLRIREEATEAAAGRRGEISALRQRQATEEAGVTPAALRDEDLATNYGNNVADAIERGSISDIHAGLDDLAAANKTLIDDFRALVGDADTITDASALSQNLGRNLDEIFGASKGADKWTTKTGIYGILNHIRAQANRKISGRTMRAFDLTTADRQVETAIQQVRKSMGSAFPEKLQAQHKAMITNSGGKVTYRELDAAINEIDGYITIAAKEGNANHLPRLNALKNHYEKVRIKGLYKLDDTGKLAGMYKAAKKAEAEVHDIWTQALRQGIEQGNADTIFKTLVGGMQTPAMVDSFIAALVKPRPSLAKGELSEGAAIASSGDLDLLRNLLKAQYRKSLGTINPEEAAKQSSTAVAGRAQTVVLDDGTRFRAVPVAGGKSGEFIETNKVWIKALFPEDPNFDKFTDVVTRGYNIQKEGARLAKAESTLREQPWIRDGSLRMDEDLGRVLREEPQRVIDTALNAKSSGEAVKTLKKIFAAAYGKSSPEYALADHQMRALIFRRILQPGDSSATAKTAAFTPSEATDRTLGLIEQYRPAMEAAYGPSQTKNIKQFFEEAANATKSSSVRETTPPAEKGWVAKAMKTPVGIAAKVYVGVLNKRARALNLGTKWLGEGDLSKFDRLLNDGELLARVLRIRKGTPRNKIMANAFGAALMITEDRAEELLDTYTVTDARGQLQPWAPTVTPEAAGRSNLIRGFGE